MNNGLVLGVITARGGSKSIPRKNIKALAGKPLLAYTIESAQQSKLLTRTVLSTDDEEIRSIGKALGCDAPFLRPVEIAQDHSTSMEAIQHALTWLKEHEGQTYEYLMILQPTSPFRTAADIDEAIRIAQEKDADSVMSMMEMVDFAPRKLKRITPDGLIQPLFEEEFKVSAHRQHDEPVYKRNAAIYLTKISLIEQGDMFGVHSYAYHMPRERSLDINTPEDFEIAEFFMQKQNKTEL